MGGAAAQAGIGVGASIIGGVIGKGGSDQAAKAAQGAAMDRQAMAEQFYGQRSEELYKQMNALEGASIADMVRMDDIIARQDKNLARQEQMISQIDPTVLEASQQALKLLRGESSSALAPLQNQRATQRQKLVSQLREQLGPGAETSTAGIQALTRFDSETSNIMAGAQQSALGQLGQTAGQFSSIRPDISRELGISAMFSGRKLGTQQGLHQAQLENIRTRASVFAPVIGAAGAQHTAGAMQGQYQAQLGGQLFGAGLSMLGGAMGGGQKPGGSPDMTNDPDITYDSPSPSYSPRYGSASTKRFSGV